MTMSSGQPTQNQPFPATPAPTTAVGAAYELMKGQPFNNLLTAAMLASIMAAAYGAYIMIPVHLKTIQEGYDRGTAAHERAIAAILESSERGVEKLAAALKEDRDMDRKHTREMFDIIIKGRMSPAGSGQPNE
jgi:hypothetical protein